MWIKVDKKTLEGFVGGNPFGHHQAEEQIKTITREALNPNQPSPMEKTIVGITRYDPDDSDESRTASFPQMKETPRGDYVELHELTMLLGEE
jgi:hypothetical protein